MTKAVFFSGSHPRHLFVHDHLINLFDEVLFIVMEREHLIPKCPVNITELDKKNFQRHFQNRKLLESGAFGSPKLIKKNGKIDTVTISPEELNSSFLVQRVKRFKAQFAFVFGCDLIKGELFEALPEFNVNLHLGLSPWYKGSATLFWPFVLLEPQFAGVTFHKLALAADAGGIIHQSTPDLKRGDGVHDVGTRCVIDAAGQAIRICKSFLANGSLEVEKQHSNGRLWLMRDFHPSHLRIIYTQFGDRIVDRYLDGDLSHRTPKLVSTLSNNFLYD